MKTIKYTTFSGIELELKPMSPDYVALIRNQIKFPEQPTYTVKLVSGDEETHLLTEESATTEEEKEKLRKYQEEYQKAEQEYLDRIIKITLRRCVKFHMPDDNSWEEEQKRDGIVIPEDEGEKKVHYLLTEVFSGLSEVMTVINQIQRSSFVSREFLQQAEDLFRRQTQAFEEETERD